MKLYEEFRASPQFLAFLLCRAKIIINKILKFFEKLGSLQVQTGFRSVRVGEVRPGWVRSGFESGIGFGFGVDGIVVVFEFSCNKWAARRVGCQN